MRRNKDLLFYLLVILFSMASGVILGAAYVFLVIKPCHEHRLALF